VIVPLLNKRAVKYVYLRVMKLSGSPEYIARGMAIGFFTAFFVLFSLQMLIAFPLLLLFRAARIPALLCTWISSPLTIPFHYSFQCYIGSYLIQRPLSYGAVKELLGCLINDPFWSSFITPGREVLTAFIGWGAFVWNHCSHFRLLYFDPFDYKTPEKESRPPPVAGNTPTVANANLCTPT
jgi:hypothetical protein